ncbi:hypothetical protein [Streptomyces sp. NPDC058299]|uniref:hypothetical protein n=1 Tax=unclassified Streptomyces TaxID=2593676 RepID=UPI0036E87F8E
MNGRRVRLAVLAPLAVSSLALGSMTFSATTAAAASPSCSVGTGNGQNAVRVSGSGFKPNKSIVVDSSQGADRSVRANGNGSFSTTIMGARGFVTAHQVGTSGARCGMVKKGQQNDAKAQYRQGFKDGFADLKKDCKKNQHQFAVPQKVDPNWQKGYDAGAATASKQFCND